MDGGIEAADSGPYQLRQRAGQHLVGAFGQRARQFDGIERISGGELVDSRHRRARYRVTQLILYHGVQLT